MALSPDPLREFKNLATSESPPSYSPLQRRATQEALMSESSPESAAAEPVDAPGESRLEESDEDESEVGGVQPPVESAMDDVHENEEDMSQPPVESVMDDVHENEEDMSEDEDNAADIAASSELALGADAPGSAPDADASSEEGEEDEAMESSLPPLPAMDSPSADIYAGGTSPVMPKALEYPEAEEEEEVESAEESEQEEPPAKKVKGNPSSTLVRGAPDSEMAGVWTQALVPVDAGSPAQVPVDAGSPGDAGSPAQEEAAQALIPADIASAPRVVPGSSSPAKDDWGALPQEAKQAWTVTGDLCSLEVDGNMLKLPRAVYDRLFSYQRQGVAWMWNLYQKGFGGILADEMGLGKTIQVAAFLACLKFANEGSRFLLVVPPTLLEQWKRELKSWASESGLAVHVMHGNQQERRTAIRGMCARAGVMLTTYDLARNCIDHLSTASMSKAAGLLPKKRKKANKRGCRDDDSPSEAEEEALPAADADDSNRPWDAVIVDEGHQIKNPSCLVGRALRKLKARSRYLLTGTPLQNKLSDLWALMDFCQPGLLGNHSTFERNFSDQIAKGSKRNATRFAVELKDHLARELKRLTGPHFLRRLKDEVLNVGPVGDDAPAPDELPSKTDIVLWLNLTNAQVELYNLFLSSETVTRATSGRNGMEALRAISMLKKLTNHPLLCLPKQEFTDWRLRCVSSSNGKVPAAASSSTEQAAPAPAEEMAGGLDAIMDDDATQLPTECQDFLARLQAMVPGSAEAATLLSCKLRILSVLLPQLQKRGHRCLIFSHSTRMLDLIQACVLRVLGLKFLRMDGTIDPKDRDLKLAKFQHPDSRYFCMCLSSQVGGVGLTITGADRVILCDPAWNPAMDAQAIDRVHRLGQKREVVVYRLIGSGTIEDKMFRLQVFKKALAKTAMEQESQIRFFTSKDLKSLFEPPSQSTSTQTLMAELLGTEALEHEDLLTTVAGDIGSTDDPDALPFWQSSDVLGFSDYQRLFMYLEQAQKPEEQAESRAKEMSSKLCNEEYNKNQVIEGKLRNKKDQENMPPQENVENLDVHGKQAVPLADE